MTTLGIQGTVVVNLMIESAQPIALLGGYDENGNGDLEDTTDTPPDDVADPGVVKTTAIDKNGFVISGATIIVEDLPMS